MIEVTYEVGSTTWSIVKLLKNLEKYEVLGFDVETAGIYTKNERKAAREELKKEIIAPSLKRQCILIENNSGLSHPSLVKTTHFIFGTSNSTSVVLVTSTTEQELLVWRWVSKQETMFLIHNTLFDLRILHHRVGRFPKNYIDTALLAKCLINNVDNYKSRIGLKVLVGDYYKPAWALFDEYEPENLMNKAFLEYASIDGAAVYKLYELLKEETDVCDKEY